MKNKFSDGRLSFFLTPRIHGNVLAWVQHPSTAETGQRLNDNILRWEDDGGTVFEIDNSLHPAAEHPLRRFPVVDNDNNIAGVIDQADIVLRVDQPEKTSEMVKEISKNEFLTKDTQVVN